MKRDTKEFHEHLLKSKDEDKFKENWERTSHIASIGDKAVFKGKENFDLTHQCTPLLPIFQTLDSSIGSYGCP